MTNEQTDLATAHAALATARTAVEARAAALQRGSDNLGNAVAEVHRFAAVVNDAEQRFAEDLAEAISNNRACPGLAIRTDIDQVHHAAERQARIAAAVMARLEQAYIAARATYNKAAADVQRAAHSSAI